MRHKQLYRLAMAAPVLALTLASNPAHAAFNPFAALSSAVSNVVNTVSKAVTSVTSSASTAVTPATQTASTSVNPVYDQLSNTLVSASGIANGLASIPVNLLANLQQAVSDMIRSGSQPEPGDYSALNVAWYMVFPEGANRPLTVDDQRYSFQPQAFSSSGFSRYKYFAWQEVEAPAWTGAKCANGSPYRFYVNLSPTGKNMLMFAEGGGVCTDYDGCNGKLVVNKDGLPRDYMKLIPSIDVMSMVNKNGSAAPTISVPHQLSSPLTTRFETLAESTRFKMQNWNMVFMPYCSADMHLASNSKLYFANPKDPKSATLYEQYAGIQNVLSVVGFLRNNLPQPAQLFITGQSAGSFAVSLGQPVIRRFMAPSDSMYTLADAGFPFDTPYLSNKTLGAPASLSQDDALNLIDENKYPSGRIVKRIYENVIGYDEANPAKKTTLKFMSELMPGIDQKRLVTILGEYHKTYPTARTAYDMAQQDQTIGGYAYNDNNNVKVLGKEDPNHLSFSSVISRKRTQLLNQELDGFQRYISTATPLQAGYFMPSGRRMMGAHVLTGLTYTDTVNRDTGHSMKDVIANLVARDRPVMLRERESDKSRGVNAQPTGLLFILDQVAHGTMLSFLP